MSERKYRHPQINLRLPEELKEKIVMLAERHHRSANTEMIAAISAWIDRFEEELIMPALTLEERVAALEQRISELEGKEIRD